jgi:hypothetical protein
MISDPGSLHDPVFGAATIDFDRMRNQVLAAGDAILLLAGLPREQIAGEYLGYRTRLAQGAPTCAREVGWQESLAQLATLVEAEIPARDETLPV